MVIIRHDVVYCSSDVICLMHDTIGKKNTIMPPFEPNHDILPHPKNGILVAAVPFFEDGKAHGILNPGSEQPRLL